MENAADWRTESRTFYSNDFKLRIVEQASHPGANVAKIARENGVAHNLIFKWLRMLQNEGRVSRRLPATLVPSANPSLLTVQVMPEPAVSEAGSGPCPLKAVRRRISDTRFIALLWKTIKAGHIDVGLFRAASEGVPQGGVISPLLTQ